jgi:D-alanyl-D-alanine carboxypeptidase (penicillin-binding protein 5/6)
MMLMPAKSPVFLILVFFLTLAFAQPEPAPSPEPMPAPGAAPAPVPSPPSFDAKSYIMMDFHSGAVLAAKNPDERVEPASITKIMTTYLVYQALREGQINLQDEVLISEKAWRMEGSRMFVEVGNRVKLEALLKGVIIQSGNDATVALAEHVAGTESAFAQLMNNQARALGLTNTHFVNSTGWPHPEHYSTARDIAILAQALIRDFPAYYAGYAEREFTFNGIKQYNRNQLLWQDESVDGLKTGHTESAGYCLVASAARDGTRLITVVMGTPNEKARAANTEALLSYGFRFFETHKLYSAGESLATPRVWQGAAENLKVGIARDLYVSIPSDRYDALSASLDMTQQILAPVEKNETLGQVKVNFAGEPLTTVPLIALESVDEGGLWRQAVDTVLMWFE